MDIKILHYMIARDGPASVRRVLGDDITSEQDAVLKDAEIYQQQVAAYLVNAQKAHGVTDPADKRTDLELREDIHQSSLGFKDTRAMVSVHELRREAREAQRKAEYYHRLSIDRYDRAHSDGFRSGFALAGVIVFILAVGFISLSVVL